MGVSGEVMEVRDISAGYEHTAVMPVVPEGYKLTEIGVIPKDWDVRKLGSLTDPQRPISYGIVQTGSIVPNGIKCLRVVDIRGGRVNKTSLITTSKAISDRYKRTILKTGDLITPLRGKVGEVALIDDELCGSNLTRGVAIISLLPQWNALFVKQTVSSPDARNRLEQSMNGSALQEVPIATLREFRIAIPADSKEQHAIATTLSDVDALLEELDRLIAKKRDLKQAAMQQLLTGQTRLPGFEGDWEVVTLGELATFYKGKGLPKSALSSHGSEPCIHYGELFTKYGVTIDETISRTSRADEEFRSSVNDVLMPTSDVTPSGLAKASCIILGDVLLGGDILVIRTNPEFVSGTFLSHIIRNDANQVLRLVTGTTVYHLYGSDMAKFEFKLPKRAEQESIVDILADLNEEIDALEQRRAKSADLKQAMMQELLTGRTRLVEPHGEEAARA